MSRNHPRHRVPRGGIDPIRSSDDALAVIALGSPYRNDTVVILLDAERRGSSILVVTDTIEPDAMFDVLESCVRAARDHPAIRSMILASCRPNGDVEADDAQRWFTASALCCSGGLELIEWFVLGSTIECPRQMIGEPHRWVA